MNPDLPAEELEACGKRGRLPKAGKNIVPPRLLMP